MTFDEWLKTEGKDFPCPVCFAEFDTREEKDSHLKNDHGYIQLGLSDKIKFKEGLS